MIRFYRILDALVIILHYSAISSALIVTEHSARTSTSWKTKALEHVTIMDDLLYPPGDSLKARTHMVKQHPIYNFLHTYYRYSTQNIKKYSPGLGVLLEVRTEDPSDSSNSADYSDSADSTGSTDVTGSGSGSGSAVDYSIDQYLHSKYLKVTAEGSYYSLPKDDAPDSTFGWMTLSKTRDILHSTSTRQPFFGCFGLHEWAMLYSGRRDKRLKVKTRHQALPLRVSQDIIDDAVEASSALRCTHYDAFRFFHPSAQPLNSVSMPTRDFQEENEQPGCVHAAMDLFKYAYQLYPFVSSDLLRECLLIAIRARKIDMRASPYDVSHVKECAGPICVETPEGRKAYVVEQEALALAATPIRLKLIDAYNMALSELSV